MNVKPIAVVLRRPVCTWLTKNDYEALAAIIARTPGVSMAAYLRSIVVDAIAEETGKRTDVIGSKRVAHETRAAVGR